MYGHQVRLVSDDWLRAIGLMHLLRCEPTTTHCGLAALEFVPPSEQETGLRAKRPAMLLLEHRNAIIITNKNTDENAVQEVVILSANLKK